MYELIQVTDTCFYIQSPAKIGLYKVPREKIAQNNGARDKGVKADGGQNKEVLENEFQDVVYLIDSGNDKDAGKKVKKILDAKGWKLQAILNTHSHADHIGGNQYLQKQTGCKIFAPGIERDFTEHPILEPAFLYGAWPYKELRHKFLMAQGSEVLPLNEACLPDGLKMISLPRHSWDMVGFRTRDGIVYLADCLSSQDTLEKYQISFLVDVKAYIATLKEVLKMDAKLFIPAHAEPTEDIRPLAQLNIDKVHEIGDKIVGICREPLTFDSILQRLFTDYQLTMTFEQHALAGSTVRSYLTWLKEEGQLQAEIDNNKLLWKA